MRASLRIDQGRCNGCQACVRSCPAEALAFVVSEERVEVTWDPGGVFFVVAAKQYVYKKRCDMRNPSPHFLGPAW